MLAALPGCSHKTEDCVVFNDALTNDPPAHESSLAFDAKSGAVVEQTSRCAARDIDKTHERALRDGEAIVLFKSYVGVRRDVCNFKREDKELTQVQDQMRAYCKPD